MSKNFGLSSPWMTLYREIDALFGEDPSVRVTYAAGDGNDPVIRLYVDGQDKADALKRLLPSFYEFGNVSVELDLVPSNAEVSTAELFRRAFGGNPAFSYAATLPDVASNEMNYVVFRNKVVQFFNDDLGDINGNETTLYEDIARKVMPDVHVFFCTDTPDNAGKQSL